MLEQHLEWQKDNKELLSSFLEREMGWVRERLKSKLLLGIIRVKILINTYYNCQLVLFRVGLYLILCLGCVYLIWNTNWLLFESHISFYM